MNLAEPLLDSAATAYVPNKLIFDKTMDCDAVRDRLSEERGEGEFANTAWKLAMPQS